MSIIAVSESTRNASGSIFRNVFFSGPYFTTDTKSDVMRFHGVSRGFSYSNNFWYRKNAPLLFFAFAPSSLSFDDEEDDDTNARVLGDKTVGDDDDDDDDDVDFNTSSFRDAKKTQSFPRRSCASENRALLLDDASRAHIVVVRRANDTKSARIHKCRPFFFSFFSPSVETLNNIKP
tara:strand:+ start:880 stop:1410 length:531 start_codon:yes stop_codon:yes gene_type:complete